MGEIVIVTGASRGIGKRIVEELRRGHPEYTVVGAMRNPPDADASGHSAALDLTSDESISRFVAEMKAMINGGSSSNKLHALVNNAGVYPGGKNPVKDVGQLMRINFHGPRILSDALRPLFCPGVRIVNISSGLGEMSGFSNEASEALMAEDLSEADLVRLVEDYMGGRVRGWPMDPYSASKGALNALTRIQNRDWSRLGLVAVSVCPGWVQTDMGGPGAPRSIEKGAETPLWAITTENLEGGLFYRDRRPIPW